MLLYTDKKNIWSSWKFVGHNGLTIKKETLKKQRIPRWRVDFAVEKLIFHLLAQVNKFKF